MYIANKSPQYRPCLLCSTRTNMLVETAERYYMKIPLCQQCLDDDSWPRLLTMWELAE